MIIFIIHKSIIDDVLMCFLVQFLQITISSSASLSVMFIFGARKWNRFIALVSVACVMV